MKLTDLATTKKTKLVQNVFEGFFEQRLNLNRLNEGQAQQFLNKVQKLLEHYKSRPDFYHSQNNSAYLKLLMLEQGLTDYLNSGDQPDHNQMLAESEVQQAQVVLAAQDLVDKIQNMVEEVSEAQFKELPALVDSIKNNIGTDQSLQFNRDVTQALESLIANLQNTKQQLQTALNLVTGEVDTSNAMPMPGMDQTQMPPDMTAQEPSPDAEPPPTDLGTELQPLGGANLGRERR